MDQVVGGVDELVVGTGCVVDVVARAVVVVDDGTGARVGGGFGLVGAGAVVTGLGAVVGAAATVVVVVVVAVLVLVEVEPDVAVVAGTPVEAGATVEATRVFSAACRLARSTDRDPPGGPRSTSAPMQSAANAIRTAQVRHASHVRCRRRDFIASSSSNGPPT